MRAHSNPGGQAIANAAVALSDQGYALVTDWIEPLLSQALRREADDHDRFGRLTPAGTGQRADQPATRLRGDDTLWLDDPACGTASHDFLSALGTLRGDLNQSLLLGMDSIQAHYAHYPTGAGYIRHRDRFRADDSRVLSLVCYLNPDWPDDAGGALRLHLADGIVDIAPSMGTMVLFLSDEIEHEVMPATQPRFSIAAWFLRHPHL
jgi:SM-20-related protein